MLRAEPTITFEAFGVCVAVELSDQTLLPHVRDMLPPGWASRAPLDGAAVFALRESGPGRFTVSVAGSPCLEHGTLDDAVGALDAQIRLHMAISATGWVFVHAGVASWGGKAIVIPGVSLTGKSTLVQALILAGADYCSDEFAVIDGHGGIHPYPRRLSIRDANAGVTHERAPADLGASVQDGPVEAAIVVLTRYREGAEWAPRRVSPAAGMVALLANTAAARDRPAQCMAALARAVRGVTVLDGERGEAEPVATSLLSALRGADPGDGAAQPRSAHRA
jgi:hypothetical protein